jgi:serine/threonine protein phosphatase PrpC
MLRLSIGNFVKRMFVKSDATPSAPAFRAVTKAALRSDSGNVRDHNEDAILFKDSSLSHLSLSRGALAIIADGMGGHTTGELASSLACQVISERYFAESGHPIVALRKAIQAANDAIHQAARMNPQHEGMGTTCTCLAVVGSEAVFAWVGDTRLYLQRAGELYRLTEDHTLVGQLVRDGLLEPAEAAVHPDRSVLSRALGTQPTVEVSTCTEPTPVRIGDRFIICSDGLHDLVSDADILNISKDFDLEITCETLVSRAKALGGFDNISVVVLDISSQFPSEKPRETREAVVL